MSFWVDVPSAVVGASFTQPVGGASRATTVLYPPFYDSSIAYPVVFVLHHYAANGADAVSRLGMTTGPWFDDGCIIIAPDGQLGGDTVTHYWDFFSGPTSTDFLYLKGCLDDLIANGWNVDTSKIYALGYSNGAFMAQELVHTFPLTFTSGFAYSGCVLKADSLAALSVAVPFAHWHGTADGTVHFNGYNTGDLTGNLPGYIGGNEYLGAFDSGSAHGHWNNLADTTWPGTPYASIDFMSEVAGSETDQFAIVGPTSTNTAVEVWKGNSCTHTISISSTGGEIPYTWMTTNRRDVSYGVTDSTLDPTTISAAGIARAGGTLTTTLDPTTEVGTAIAIDHGALTTTLDPTTVAATALAPATGTATPQLAGATIAATGEAIAHGQAAPQLDDATLVATGGAVDHGAVSTQLDDATSTATGQALVKGQDSTTLADATLTGTGLVLQAGAAAGELDATLGDATSSATGKAIDHGQASPTLADATVAGTAITDDHGQATIQLEGASSTASGTVPAHGALTTTLAGATLAATGKALVHGAIGVLASTLADATASATASPRGSAIPADALFENVRIRLRPSGATLVIGEVAR